MRWLGLLAVVALAGCKFDSGGFVLGNIDASQPDGTIADGGADGDAVVVDPILSVLLAGNTASKVTSLPVGIDCGTSCMASFPLNSMVQLTPMPDGASMFVGWSGACNGAGACSVRMDGAKMVTATFAPITTHLWSRRLGGADYDFAFDVATNAAGETVVVGECSAMADIGSGVTADIRGFDIFVSRFMPSGAPVWVRRIGGVGNDAGSAVAITAQGDVVLAGWFSNTADFGMGSVTPGGSYDLVVLKLAAANGATLWQRTFSGAEMFGYDLGLDSAGNIFVTGTFKGTATFGTDVLMSAGSDDIFVAKLSGANGAPIWAKRYGASAADSGNGIAVDASGGVVVTGAFQGSVDFGGGARVSMGMEDVFVLRLDADGMHQWSFGYGLSNVDIGRAVALDNNDPVVVGQYRGALTFGPTPLPIFGRDDLFAVRFASNGSHLWSRGFGSAQDDLARGVAVGAGGLTVVGGTFGAVANFGTGDVTPAGGSDVVVLGFDAAGARQWTMTMGGVGADDLYSVAHSAGSFAVTGVTTSTPGVALGAIDFGGGPLPGFGMPDAFVARLRR